MPVYEYECTKCGNHIEVFQRMNDKPLTRCDHCKGKVKKLISQSTFHLKGTGWYVTDYASKSGGNQGSSYQQSKDKKETKTNSASASTEKKASSAGAKASEKKV